MGIRWWICLCRWSGKGLSDWRRVCVLLIFCIRKHVDSGFCGIVRSWKPINYIFQFIHVHGNKSINKPPVSHDDSVCITGRIAFISSSNCQGIWHAFAIISGCTLLKYSNINFSYSRHMRWGILIDNNSKCVFRPHPDTHSGNIRTA